jgi:hypothetical protein
MVYGSAVGGFSLPMSPYILSVFSCLLSLFFSDKCSRASVLNLTEIEAKVYELTNNEPQAMSTSDMNTIAQSTHD